MNEKIEKSINILTDKLGAETKGDEALKLSQAALNLAHVAQVWQHVMNHDKQ